MLRFFFCLCLIGMVWSCNYTYKIRTGDQAFEVKHYARAASLYTREFEEAKDQKTRALKAYQLGLCAKLVGDYSQALKWFRKAYDLNSGAASLWEYAFALKLNGEYEAAADAFKQYGEETGRKLEARKEANICNLVNEWKNNPSEYVWSLKEAGPFESDGSLYGFQKIDSSKQLYVAEQWSSTTNDRTKFEWTGRPFSKIVLKEAGRKEEQIFEDYSNESVFAYSHKSQLLYFTRCYMELDRKQLCKIYTSSILSDREKELDLMEVVKPEENAMHPAVHPSDSILVFSSNRAGGLGGWDLYICHKNGDTWSEALNLGDVINTSGDEVFPIFNGDTLYYSSDGLVGMGGLDIFKTALNNTNGWLPPQNLRSPINSEADDFEFFIDPYAPLDQEHLLVAYFSSNRNSGVDRIVSVTKSLRKSTPELPKKETKFKFDIQVNLRFVEAVAHRLQSKKTLDSLQLTDKGSKHSFNTGKRLSTSLKLIPGLTYQFLVTKDAYLNRLIEFSAPESPNLERDSSLVMDLEFEMIPEVYNREFLLRELYYDFDRWNIRPDAIAPLEELKTIMVTNPNIKVLIGSHTDCRGSIAYNLQLSERRAESAANWLIAAGINRQRIQFKGYGFSVPAVDCICKDCTEEAHQSNRRSTFQLIP